MAKVFINSMAFPQDPAEVGLPQRLPVTLDSERFEGSDGRVFVNASPQELVRFFQQGGKDLPIDIEHSTQLQARKGLPAPAVGWITGLEDDGYVVYAIVNWTEKGAELLKSGSYKYYSPAYYCVSEGKGKENRITGLASIGLTNIPHLPVPALNHEGGMEGEEMDKIVVCNALGIDTQTADEQVVEQINLLRTQREEALNRASAAENKLSDTEARLAGIEKAALQAEINSAVGKAVSDGKILPYQKDHFEKNIKTREELNSFNEMIAKAPVQLPGGSQVDGKNPEEKHQELNADQQAVVDQFGSFSEEEMKKIKEESAK